MLKVMYFLTGNAEGFRVSEKTVLERCNISESGYKKARKKLVSIGWLTHKAEDYIQVNFNKIFSDYRALQEQGSQKTKKPRSLDDDFALDTSTEGFSHQAEDTSENTIDRCFENTHNSISNNTNNNIENRINDKGFRCEDTRSRVADATLPQVSSQPLREVWYSKEEIEEAEKQFSGWFWREERRISANYNLEDDAEYKKMGQSEEYKAFQKEVEEKREALKKKYG